MQVNATAPARKLSAHDVSYTVIKAAMKVHSALGPGLLESAYEACLVHELRKAGFRVEQHVELPVHYDGVRIDVGYGIDLLVNDSVIVELKCVENLAAVYEAQVISY